MAGERIAWTGPPEVDDEERFLILVDRLVDRVSAHAPIAVHAVRIDNWFGPKWLGFAGKVLGALGVHQDTTRADLVVPPFTPGRVVWEHRFALDAEGRYFVRDAGRALHRKQTSSTNLTRKLAEITPRMHFVWFSGNTRTNGRGSVLVASLNHEEQSAYYLGFAQKRGRWQLDDVAGNPPVAPMDLRMEAPSIQTLVFGDIPIARIRQDDADFSTESAGSAADFSTESAGSAAENGEAPSDCASGASFTQARRSSAAWLRR